MAAEIQELHNLRAAREIYISDFIRPRPMLRNHDRADKEHLINTRAGGESSELLEAITWVDSTEPFIPSERVDDAYQELGDVMMSFMAIEEALVINACEGAISQVEEFVTSKPKELFSTKLYGDVKAGNIFGEFDFTGRTAQGLAFAIGYKIQDINSRKTELEKVRADEPTDDNILTEAEIELGIQQDLTVGYLLGIAIAERLGVKIADAIIDKAAEIELYYRQPYYQDPNPANFPSVQSNLKEERKRKNGKSNFKIEDNNNVSQKIEETIVFSSNMIERAV